MAKLIIYVTGPTVFYGYKRGPFIWDESQKVFVFESKTYDEKDFNASVNKVLHDYADMGPSVRIVEFSAPTVTVEVPHVVTLEEAKEVVQRLDPTALRKKPGRKPTKSSHQ